MKQQAIMLIWHTDTRCLPLNMLKQRQSIKLNITTSTEPQHGRAARPLGKLLGRPCRGRGRDSLMHSSREDGVLGWSSTSRSKPVSTRVGFVKDAPVAVANRDYGGSSLEWSILPRPDRRC
jgi:hypothetical protein